MAGAHRQRPLAACRGWLRSPFGCKPATVLYPYGFVSGGLPYLDNY